MFTFMAKGKQEHSEETLKGKGGKCKLYIDQPQNPRFKLRTLLLGYINLMQKQNCGNVVVSTMDSSVPDH